MTIVLINDDDPGYNYTSTQEANMHKNGLQ